MIIIGKYVRSKRLPPPYRKKHKKAYLFEPVIGLGRNHTRLQHKSDYKQGCWYMIRGKKSKYIDSKNETKNEIVAKRTLKLL